MATTADRTGASTDATTVKTGARTDETAASDPALQPARPPVPGGHTFPGRWEVAVFDEQPHGVADEHVVHP